MEKIRCFFSSLSRRKQIRASEIAKTQLSRCLSLVDLTALGIGSTLGAGVYVVVGEVARTSSGPGVILSFLIAALSSILSGLCYAEFGARVPKTGSAYVYSYVAVGEFMAFVTGWNLILQYVIGTSSVARAWSSNFDGIVGGKISGFFSEHLAMNATGLAEYVDPFAFGITLVVTGVLSVGAQESSLVNNVFTLINLGVISYVVITGLFRVKLANWQVNPANVPPDDPNKAHVGAGGFLPFGISGVISGAGTCFYSFVGFDIIATTGEEVRNPQRAIPIAILVCLLTCFVAYASISAVLTLMVPYYSIPTVAPLPYAFESVGWNVARYVIAVGAVCALTTSLLGSMFPLPRILYAMASDGLIFRFFGRINKRFKTPLFGTVISGVFAGILAAVFSLKDLVDMMSIGTLFAYSLVAASVLILRGQQSFIFILPSDDNGSAATEPLGDNVYQITLPANDESLQASMHRQPWNQPSQ
ncbi:High-affinity cationic amino acid transporter 1 [Fasciolopsis buskii]|uniref:High-affinity cationic amino acid transporter 1 n=1 Tax=Fasciolopsis buskii TaxID=27845 RepID=A0A8E0VL29_9TREM|nr:High-affinity cationic amino acid transporter 1 [Fasciolopsis buski]